MAWRGARFGRTGAGMPSGAGFAGGYGVQRRSAYATPWELGPKPWTPDFVVDGGRPGYPVQHRINPYAFKPSLQWRTEDWDPALRHWAVGFDPQLTEWLQDLDLAAPSVLAGREFARQHARWRHADADGNLAKDIDSLVGARWLRRSDVAWYAADDADDATRAAAWAAIRRELGTLDDLMQITRARYQAECLAQADGIPRYFMHLLAMDGASRPWTMALIRCGLSIGNIAYMDFKARFKRLRPSSLCPGLVPPFGPPRHPAFPSGHSFLAHFISLLLLEVEGIAQRYGMGIGDGGIGRKPCWEKIAPPKPAEATKSKKPPDERTPEPADPVLDGPLFWLAERLATNRERIGVHYPSDSAAGRHLAIGIWNAIFGEVPATQRIDLPTLQRTLRLARAEWEAGVERRPAGKGA
jgi:membrane-associated phospholipid phosphatase